MRAVALRFRCTRVILSMYERVRVRVVRCVLLNPRTGQGRQVNKTDYFRLKNGTVDLPNPLLPACLRRCCAPPSLPLTERRCPALPRPMPSRRAAHVRAGLGTTTSRCGSSEWSINLGSAGSRDVTRMTAGHTRPSRARWALEVLLERGRWPCSLLIRDSFGGPSCHAVCLASLCPGLIFIFC